jgi:GNAT superfamily N-acetyltransferase
MDVSLRPATQEEYAFCESLSRRNMGDYLAARKVLWDPDRFLASWATFENLVIAVDSRVVGLLRLAPEEGALGLRDLQIVPEYQGRGIGAWAVRQAQSIAASRGFRRLQLRVYEDNPAKALYARSGFRVESVVDGAIHMACDLPPHPSSSPDPLRGLD